VYVHNPLSMGRADGTQVPRESPGMNTAFAEYLFTHGQISPDVARSMSHWVTRTPTPIGMIAVGHGLISSRQIDEILERQRVSRTRFGEVAVALDLLSKDQVETLLEIQQFCQSADLAEGLALAGVLPFRVAARALGDFLRTESLDALELCVDTPSR